MNKHLWGAPLPFSPDLSWQEIQRNVMALKQIGVDGAFIGLTGRHPELTADFSKALKTVLSDNGLSVCQLHPLWPDLAAADKTTRESAITYYKKAIDTAHLLGTDVVIIHPGGSESDLADDDQTRVALDRNIESLAILQRYAGDNPVRLAVENMAEYVKGQPRKRRYGRCAGDLLNILAAMGLGRIGICFDTSHALASGHSVTGMIRQFGEKIIASHLHDTDGNIDKHLAIGQGIINWQETLQAFDKIGYHSCHVIETSHDDVAPSLAHLAFLGLL